MDGRTDRATCMDLKYINNPSTIKPFKGETRMNLNAFLIAETPFYGNFLFGVNQDGLSKDL